MVVDDHSRSRVCGCLGLWAAATRRLTLFTVTAAGSQALTSFGAVEAAKVNV